MIIFRIARNVGCLSSHRQFHISNTQREAIVISGKKIAQEIKEELKNSVDLWVTSGKRRPRLTAILVGNDPASEVYVGRKIKAASSIGIHAETILLDANIKQQDLIKEIQRLNNDCNVDGVLVQLPLPKGLDEKEACHTVWPSKDVDGFHSENLGKLSTDSEGFVPATALAVRELILRSGIKTIGRNAVVIGRSKHVGLPTALLLHANGKGDTRALDMTTTICHIHTPREELIKLSRLADVLVSATGVPGLVTKDMIKPGACVIDVGITRVDIGDGKTKIVGDVDYDEVKNIAGFITPVPGGVGPMTVAILSSEIISIFNTTRKKVIPKYVCDFRSIVTMTSKMSRPKVLITRGDIPSAGLSLLQEQCDLIVWNETTPIPRSELLSKIVDVDGVFCLLTDKIDEEILSVAGSQLKVIATMSVGLDHLDLNAIKSRNIHVGYTPDVLTDATSELAIALLLSTSRRIIEAEHALRAGKWTSWSPLWMCGPGLAGSTVGIVGLGRIGTRIAEYLKPFRVEKILYTSRSEKISAKTFNGIRVSLNDLLSQSDFIIVTIAMTSETRGMFDSDAFKKMKKNSIFINVSRGEIVDQSALIEALKSKSIRAAGLDVMTPEPIPLDHELLKLDNCVLLPHIGSASTEVREKMAIMTANNILAVINGKPESMPAQLNL
ncbi:hypothetical protein PV327_009271 [Microctonus hyperodae]|uniref:Glyoxylate reductase/hydroxypyruvate reductase n=1 Tax=Microctonus hyperodae TaxID=165561 RepID=A0AA39KVW2_MICHY|nr:hypothetical protein PV327_009271 [Microctonus hyperodae]